MLILTRKVNESITCKLADGSKIEITLTKLKSGNARIGFNAPESVSIVRNELTNKN